MSDNTPPAQQKENDRYFRSTIAGLMLHVAPANIEKNEVAPHTVRFTPIFQRWDGEMTKFGYLKTSNKKAIEMCLADPNVSEIDAKEYDLVMDKVDDPKQVNYKRAAL